MRKHYSKLLLTFSLVGIMSVNVFGAVTFTDVKENHWAYTAMSYMQDKGYMTKNSSGEFAPTQEVTYFEVAEVLAKATGYQDELVIKDMDPTLKKQIAENYEAKKPLLKTYMDKYSAWETRCNEEIAYLLGRGYLKEEDLSRFMIKSAEGKEFKNTLTKQDLAAFLVRVIGKEVTAKEKYTGKTKFTDNDLIREENRPHVAYLSEIGLLNGDAKGNMGANTKVTRALCAQMTYSALVYKEKLDKEEAANKPQTKPEDNTSSTTPDAAAIKGKINKVVPKNNAANENYVLLEVNGKTTFYTANPSTKVTNASGQVVDFSKVTVGENVAVTVAKENGIELIKTIQLLDNTTGGTTTTPDTSDKEDTTEDTETMRYLGDVENIGRSGSISVSTNAGIVTYLLADQYSIVEGTKTLTLEDLSVGDRVRIYIEDNKIVKVNILARAQVNETEAEFVRIANRVTSYSLTIADGTKESILEVDLAADITRNGKVANVQDLRMGDTLKLEMDGGVVTSIEATGEESSFVGTVESVILSSTPQIAIKTKNDLKIINITKNTDIYDATSRKDITVRDILLNARVEVIADSSEALSIVVKEVPTEMVYTGTVENVGPSAKYIDVLVDYDELTGESKVLKRIEIPTQVEIIVEGQASYRNQIKKGNKVEVTYNYNNLSYPEIIEVIKK
ncbi:S-layer homology domain-containing protein [Niameybacter massiliensis]|uniref:S-layer homology domain-containing protein n=1 Tax=Holtiella tumoricola TaxID=3018743 RepID=A0AA42DQ01_9FIRM|nr:S-layer homology domain-containing protein [Holtiella tumoricola]MDA3733139.1 S-layer homology domain-containing protein [Holtiella tumoricola]